MMTLSLTLCYRSRSPVKAITARDLLAQLEEQGLVYDEVEF